MLQSGKILPYLFVSLCVHLAVLQLGARQATVQTRDPGFGIAFVASPVEPFAPGFFSAEPDRNPAPEKAEQAAPGAAPARLKDGDGSPEKEILSARTVPLDALGQEKQESSGSAKSQTVAAEPGEQQQELPEKKGARVETGKSRRTESSNEDLQALLGGRMIGSSADDVTPLWPAGKPAKRDKQLPAGAETGSRASQDSGVQRAMPRYDINPKPRYPEIARRKGWQGTVKLQVFVLADGHVGSVEIFDSSGRRQLDRAARRAVSRWVFKPATFSGQPIESRVVVPVDFVLTSR